MLNNRDFQFNPLNPGPVELKYPRPWLCQRYNGYSLHNIIDTLKIICRSSVRARLKTCIIKFQISFFAGHKIHNGGKYVWKFMKISINKRFTDVFQKNDPISSKQSRFIQLLVKDTVSDRNIGLTGHGDFSARPIFRSYGFKGLRWIPSNQHWKTAKILVPENINGI